MSEISGRTKNGRALRVAGLLGSMFLTACFAGCAARGTADSAGVVAPDFWFVFLERGKPTPPDRALVAKMQQGHLANFQKLHGEKKLFAAGPLRDPSGLKRGIVVLKAANPEVASRYFDADEYVRDGYMTLNMNPARARLPLRADPPDPSGIEEVRIIQIARSSQSRAHDAHFQSMVDSGLIGGWYELPSGPLSDVLFSREKDDAKLRAAVLAAPGINDAQVQIWAQYLSKQVVR